MTKMARNNCGLWEKNGNHFYNARWIKTLVLCVTSHRDMKQHYPPILLPAFLQQNRILRLRVLDRKDRFLGDSFSESGAKVNCVMFRACLLHACVFLCINVCVCIYVCPCVKLHFTCVSMPIMMPLHVRVWVCEMLQDTYQCVCVCVFLLCVHVYCAVWQCVGS